MQLPGGINTSGGIDKGYSFKPLTGFDEMYLWDVSSTQDNRLDVTCGILNTFVELSTDADNLCVADSLYLLSRLAIKLDAGFFWLSAVCGSCSTQFDVPVDLSCLPVKTAEASYPSVEKNFGKTAYGFRVPRLADLKSLDNSLSSEDATKHLIESCQIEGPAREFTKKERAEISEALETVSPEIPISLQSACPECAEVNDIPFDTAAHLISFFKNPLEDVHEIASAYHWTEAEILALSRSRREAYLSLIERDAGVVS